MELDLAALSLLPDSVKRRILGKCEISAPSRQQDEATRLAGDAPSAAAAQDHARAAAVIAGRQLQLPRLAAGACIVDGVLSSAEAHDVAAAVHEWLQAHGRRPGMGSAGSGGLWADDQHRGDITSWVSLDELAAAGQHLLAAVLRLVMSARQQLAARGHDVGGRCSMQLACYPGGGARYVRHTDASDAIPDRTVTALLYLNSNWDAQGDGGQLALYNASHICASSSGRASPAGGDAAAAAPSEGRQGAGSLAGEPALLVSPLAGRLLVFDSSLPHEVLPAQRHRYSITCWFYKAKAVAAGTAAAGADAAADSEAGAVQRTSAHPPERMLLPPAPTPAAAAAVPRIFVSIVAFRDEECQWTLRDLFLRAALPERVFVGVVWQLDPEADAAFARMAGGAKTAAFQAQVRELRCHYSTASGPCAARSLAQQLWAGEEYVLQIDAHMRFVQDWDLICLEQLRLAEQAAGSRRVVLSTYPLGYSGCGAAAAVPEDPPATLLCAKAFDDSGLLRIQSRTFEGGPAGPVPSLFWAAGFSFASSSLLLEVPYCPHLPHLFFGEELFMLARLWTRGWQVWAPAVAVLFHQWERSARAHSFQACVQVDAQARAQSQAHVLQLLQPRASSSSSSPDDDAAAALSVPPPALQHPWRPPVDADWAIGGVWGLGTSRTLQQLQEHLGVDFAGRVISERARWGGQPGPGAFAE